MFCYSSLHAQIISGTVSAEGQVLPGAAVIIKGSTKGTSTDFDGYYTIEAQASDVLVFSYVGYANKEVTVGTNTQIDVALEADNTLDEVVVIGYGTQRKSDLTGSVSSVSAEDVNVNPVSRVDQALQGRAAGVQVTQTSGAPGAASVIRVRGGNSITGSNEPLWVIDGIVVGTNFNLNNINSNDIKSIEILKDASSIAIYGSRGANGVVLVTTKTGTGAGSSKPEVSANIYTSMQMVPELPKMLSQAEQIAYTNESAAFRGAAIPFPNDPSTYPNNDWFDLLLGPAPIYNADVSITGASENVSYYTSLNYFNQEGIVKTSGIEKYIFRSNLDIRLSDKLKTGFRVNYSYIDQQNGLVGYGNAIATLPTQPIYNEDGSYNGFDEVVGSPWSNPIANMALNTNETFRNNFLGSFYIDYSPSEKWIIRSTFSPDFDNSKQNRFTSSQSPNLLYLGEGGNASVRTVNTKGWNNENTIQYQSEIGENHRITALGGASFQKVSTEIVESEAFGITNDATGFNNLSNSDPTRNILTSDYSGFQIASFFGRLNYAYKDKYLLTLVGRTDGSSVFSDDNKYEFYPSIAAAWKISEEGFMQNQETFGELKLRASYGKSGNQAIDPYRTKGLLVEANTTLNGIQQTGLTLGRPSNPNLTWETTNSLDIALEASMFNGRVFAELNYYYKKTNDLLLDVTIPKQTGFNSQLQNVGSLENKGWEFSLNTTNVRTDNFNWKSTLMLSSNKNKILDLGGVDFIDLVVDELLGSGNTRLIVGESVPVFTGVKFLGTWKSQEEIDASGLRDPQVVGGAKYHDENGDGIISTDDAVVLGSPLPDLIFGFENTLSYKNLDFSFYFQGTQGNEVYNLRMRNHYFNRGEFTKFAEVADRWTPENPTSDIPRAGGDSVTGTPPNSAYVEDGSHIRLKTVRLAYNMPVDKMGMDGVKNATVYLTGTNLLLWSDFRLIDPEGSNFGRNGIGNIAQGYNDGSYPNPRTITLGLNVTF
ncbi:TonB-dependent receptor [Formosa agariphila KMM 3901]|uniref:TonB-dependent receptor P26 n=2 Tax=Formosa TaxID=225842 RepID=PLH26_FORAG|nr:RecName: Full=TonB-dependent receptor P26; Short=P26_TBDR; AltName: Full=Polysaccharide utilization locus H protein P26; Short=PUL H protein P26 [Formosa agariphila KMM 3901]CDF79927.1 TonB-dependent receptor [Formosa agariphila KMM 3901]